MQPTLCSVILIWLIIGPLDLKTSVKGQFQQSASILHGKTFLIPYSIKFHFKRSTSVF